MASESAVQKIKLRWTAEEDAMLIRLREEWSGDSGKAKDGFYQKAVDMLPHRSHKSVMHRLTTLISKGDLRRWRLYDIRKPLKLTASEAAWLAALFEGEGSISAKEGKWTGGVALCHNNELAILQRVVSLVPMAKLKVSKKAGTRRGITTNKDVYVAILYDFRSILDFFKNTLPFITEGTRKRARVEALIAYCRERYGLEA